MPAPKVTKASLGQALAAIQEAGLKPNEVILMADGGFAIKCGNTVLSGGRGEGSREEIAGKGEVANDGDASVNAPKPKLKKFEPNHHAA